MLFKRQDITFWLKFVDKFGSPTSVGKYPNGASDKERGTLLAALNAIANDAGDPVAEGLMASSMSAGVLIGLLIASAAMGSDPDAIPDFVPADF